MPPGAEESESDGSNGLTRERGDRGGLFGDDELEDSDTPSDPDTDESNGSTRERGDRGGIFSDFDGSSGGSDSSSGSSTSSPTQSDSSSGRDEAEEEEPDSGEEDRQEINPGEVSAEFRDAPVESSEPGESTRERGDRGGIFEDFDEGSQTEPEREPDHSLDDETAEQASAGRFGTGATGVPSQLSEDTETRQITDGRPEPADELTPEQRQSIREDMAADSPFEPEDFRVTDVRVIGAPESETAASIRERFSAGQRRRIREEAADASPIFDADDIVITGIGTEDGEEVFEFDTAPTEVNVDTDFFARREVVAEQVATESPQFDAEDVSVTASEDGDLDVQIRDSAQREALLDDFVESEEQIGPDGPFGREDVVVEDTDDGFVARVSEDAIEERIGQAEEIDTQTDFGRGRSGGLTTVEVATEVGDEQTTILARGDDFFDPNEIREIDISRDSADGLGLDISFELEDGRTVSPGTGDEIFQTDLPTTTQQAIPFIRSRSRIAVSTLAAPALATADIGERAIDTFGIDSRDATAVAAGAVVAPEPVTSAGGAAVLAATAAASGLGAARQRAEIEVPEERQEFEQVEITVPDQGRVTQSELEAGTGEASVTEIEQPETAESTREAEISVPDSQEQTQPTEIQAQPVSTGLLQEGVREVEEEDFREVDETPTVIREEDLEDTGPLVDIPEIEQERQIREELERRQEFEREGGQDFTQVREELPGRIEPVDEGIQSQEQTEFIEVEQVDSSFSSGVSGSIGPREDFLIGPEIDVDVSSGLDARTDTIPDVDADIGSQIDSMMDVGTMTDTATVTATDTATRFEFAEPGVFAQPAEFVNPNVFAQPIQPGSQATPAAVPTPRIDIGLGDVGEDIQGPSRSRGRREFIFDLDLDDVSGDFEI